MFIGDSFDPYKIMGGYMITRVLCTLVDLYQVDHDNGSPLVGYVGIICRKF